MSEPTGQIVDHLFRHEWGKLVTVLTKLMGPHGLQTAEDIANDTLLAALQQWKIKGVPANATAWLFAVARNKAIDKLRRQQLHQQYQQEVSPLLKSEYSLAPAVAELVNEKHLADDQLKMMLVCCAPGLQPDAQLALMLKTLCGFSVAEIASAFIAQPATIEKRLYRARQYLKEQKVNFDWPPEAEMPHRINTVLKGIYLLFNEGYNSTHNSQLIRTDLMNEAIRLCHIIAQNTNYDTGAAHALLSLMYFTASRNEARQNTAGQILLLHQQDRSLWNRQCMGKAIWHLQAASATAALSEYHIQAGIAYEHAKASQYNHTNWAAILQYYQLLMEHYSSPIVALNQAIAIGEHQGPQACINELAAWANHPQLQHYYLYHATLGEMYARLRQQQVAIQYLKTAQQLTHAAAEQQLLQQKIDDLLLHSSSTGH
jgi:RNA polymerase sigma-70 factor (ECF subfamily)